SNNLYHDAQTTEKLAAMAVQCATEQGKRVAVVGIGGLSGSLFRTELDPQQDRIASSQDDDWNQRILRLIEAAD
ncbi:MAG TPA: tRNA U-34 5-methylaminomethyl-2-thiouridine biosynthesis protein, partial [Pusillimonas sp.]|nr:tRNA U-34 5-methylaminomethyl-2-thiouridine biosynthesis protein [Pusillimonas sp.]